ncbi:acyl-homoserine-lactone synthase [Sagittula sp. P11]|uniref:acyl-homoserine-lactone synthase n=1 Tax=Sagittula sp. P11 TaxID=2009329 RepID=UPI0012FD5F95|nr:acyl-homoserine-lactone synthase [Sagittula sp. P11]
MNPRSPYDIALVDITAPDLDHDLYWQCLSLRREVFISTMGWNLFQRDGCEFDAYDTPASVHLAALDGGRVEACMRLMRTDNDQGGVTYMILDAHLGRIPNLPTGLLDQVIATPFAWEASRLAISSRVPVPTRNAVVVDLIGEGTRYAAARGAGTLLGLMKPAFERVLRRAGFDVYRAGPILDQRDGRICVLRLDFEPSQSLRVA